MKKVSTDFKIVFTIFFVLVGFVILLNFNNHGIGNETKAFRTQIDLIKEPYSFDSEAIALSDSTNDTQLRLVAIETSNLVNEIRQENDLDELTWDANLETVANVRANEISEVFSHTRPDGRDWCTVNSKIQGGENLAFGYDTAEEVVDAWMDSPMHKENILYEDFETIAISIYEDNGTYYFAQEYGY